MSGTNLLIDTNILIYLLNGDEHVSEIIKDKNIYISIITEMEILSYPKLKNEEEQVIKEAISNCYILNINNEIKQLAIQLKKNTFIKLPDAIIAATSLYLGSPFFSADKEFIKIDELNLLLLKT